MKYNIRKRENVTLYLSGPIAELDDKLFKKLKDNPYTGNSEDDFLKYISEFDFWNIPDLDLNDNVKGELEKLGPNAEMQEFGNSAEKGSNTWFELGDKDESHGKYGGFNPKISSDEWRY